MSNCTADICQLSTMVIVDDAAARGGRGSIR